ncbi:hypothetical protein Cadr_000020967 [Camelus dromedarius]|uniref:Uncharacterized protein n=1 Tax=Camelus dromedarius TaxID=9838 RepID=A0A5N4CUY3_CAMDR|nr:histone H3.v1-like isoform X2 [Camelus dromedarius]KAB1262654.1 hypothetical protein Cadr_000020967 [Camelus dromedarius]
MGLRQDVEDSRRGSDSSHKPTVSDLSLPRHESAIEIGEEEEEEEKEEVEEEEEEGKRRRKKKKKKKPLPSQDCLFFPYLYARVCVPRPFHPNPVLDV